MGNSLPLPCLRHHDADKAEGAKKRKTKQQKSGPAPACPRNAVWGAARPRHVVPIEDTPPEDGGDGGEVAFKEAWRRAGCRVVEPAGGDGEGGGGVRRVKIVMRRKDIAELVARLEKRDAADQRNAATAMEAAAELSTTGALVGGGGGHGSVNGGGVTMSPCRDAWRPRLSIIPEN
ncbi:unnamed protein product [Urochloa humidicola]